MLQKKEIRIAGASVRGVGTAQEEGKGGCCPSFARGTEKGKERVDTDNEKFEDGKRSSSQFCTEVGGEVIRRGHDQERLEVFAGLLERRHVPRVTPCRSQALSRFWSPRSHPFVPSKV